MEQNTEQGGTLMEDPKQTEDVEINVSDAPCITKPGIEILAIVTEVEENIFPYDDSY